ncbi:hypothetical protein [Embleya sp. NPDC005971]|uniref:hypothetical protein n=1 Tax=Embleya sp. NPDC005971 TaxID=3156724 RepID=UPI00340A7921
MTTFPAGPILDGLGVTVDLEDGDLPAGAVVLLKVVDRDGEVSVGIADSEGSTWLDQLALVTAARDIIGQARYSGPEFDD